MSSQERRMERYRIICLENIGMSGSKLGTLLGPGNARLERKCQIPNLNPSGCRAIQTLHEQSLQINGARLFDCVPKKLRKAKLCQDDFKYELDQYLITIPDKPRVGRLVPEAICRVSGKQSNSLTAWIQET